MTSDRYIHVRNWDRYQHPDTQRTRKPGAALPWIKSYTNQLHETEFLELSFHDRGLLESIRLAYALQRSAGVPRACRQLERLVGQRVTERALERLEQSGFLVFSASKLLATSAQDASPEGEGEQEVEQTFSHTREKEPVDNSNASSSSSTPAPDDHIWRELGSLFGLVAVNTGAYRRRLEVHAELLAQGAAAGELEHARRRWRELGRSVELTDSSLARHFPQLRPAPAGSRPKPCPECEHGGGLHLEGCSIGEAMRGKQAGELETGGDFGAFLEGSA